MEELEIMSNRELSEVEDYTIFREGYGAVSWPGKTDIRNLDIDSLVNIDRDEKGRPFVCVYEDEEKKPEQGK